MYVFLCVILFLCFSVLLVLRLPRLGKRELILVLFVCLVCACLDLTVSSSSWGLGRAAVCDCGTPWTFLLPFWCGGVDCVTGAGDVCRCAEPCVHVGEGCSEEFEVKVGVHQGSVLSPLLFIFVLEALS